MRVRLLCGVGTTIYTRIGWVIMIIQTLGLIVILVPFVVIVANLAAKYRGYVIV